MQLTVIPYQAIGPFKLGVSLPEIEGVIGSKAELLYDFKDRKYARAFFQEYGLFVEVQYPKECAAFELVLPCDPLLDGHFLLRESYSLLHSWLKSIDQDLRYYDSGVDSLVMGVSLYAPNANEEPELPPESVLVFGRDYFGRVA